MGFSFSDRWLEMLFGHAAIVRTAIRAAEAEQGGAECLLLMIGLIAMAVTSVQRQSGEQLT